MIIMCQQKFLLLFKVDIACVDNEHNEDISLYIRRRGMEVIPPVGMHILFGEYDFEITGVSAPFSFDVITCKCQLYKPLIFEQVLELMKFGWREI